GRTLDAIGGARTHRPSGLEQRLDHRVLIRDWNPDVQTGAALCLDTDLRQFLDKRIAPQRVHRGRALDLAHGLRIGPHRNDCVLQDMADPPRTEALTAFDPRNRQRMARDNREPQVGPEIFRNRSNDRPSRNRWMCERNRRRTRDRSREVIFYKKSVWEPLQERAQLARATRIEDRPGRI